jgi:hypothetical protein
MAPILGSASTDDLSVAIVPATRQAVGALHGTGSALLTTVRTAAGSWSSLAQLNGDTTQGRPLVAGFGSTADLVYWGSDYKWYLEAFSAGAWTTTSQAVVPSGATSQPCGPSPGALTVTGGAPAFVYVNGTCVAPLNFLEETDLASGTWTTSALVGSAASYVPTQWPAVAAPSTGPDLVAVFATQSSGGQLMWSSRTAGTWLSPAMITNALTNDAPVLTAIAGGGVLLAFRGTDAHLYTATYAAGAWSSPAAPFTPNVSLAAAPALAQGIGAATAELVYVDGTSSIYHTRLMGTAWSTPVDVAPSTSGFAHAAIASGP